MEWEARTAFTEIRAGTRLCIYRRMQMKGDAPARLIGNHEMPLELDDKWVTCKVVNSNGREAILELWDGRNFKMSVREADEWDSGITLRNMHSEDWIIREEIPA